MARKKKKRSKRSKNINWGQGMASFGDINATLGLVFAWIMMFGCIGFGLYLIIQGARGKALGGQLMEPVIKHTILTRRYLL